MAIQGFFTGDVKIRDLNGVLKAVNGIVEVAADAGTVTSVGLAVGSTGTDVNVANSPVTTSGNITLNLPTASATNRGLLSSADWTTFNSKQGTITLTTTGSSGAATLIGTTLNIPNYSGALTGYVPYTGATGNVDLGEYGLDTGFLNFDTTPTGTPTTQGTVYWDDSRSTLSLIMNGVTQHIGQDSFFYVKNSTGSSIPKGTSVMFNGTDGASGHLLIAPFLADGTYPSSYFMGVTAETIGNGGFGQVVNFGELEGINTSAYTAGDLLYASSTVAGGFQTTAPSAPNNIVLIAAAVNSKNNGAIVVRPTYGSNINDDEGVLITSAANNQGLFYDSATGLWKNKSIATVLGYTPANAATTLTINGTTYDISANRTWSVGTVTSVGTSGPLTGGTITGSGTIGITQSSAASDGYLSNTDWATFNNKQTALNGTGFVKISGTTISYDNSTYYLASNPSAFIALTALSATAPLSYDNTTGVFSISQATTSTNGYLSSTDWNTFNNKQAAGSYITALTGEATATGPGSASVTLSTSAVTGKILTGLNLTGGGTIADTDSILQAFGKVQNQISGLAGGVTYQGVWNASTNTPTLTSSVGTKGYYYIVDVAGSTNLNGITDWKVGDWVIFNGSTWDKVDNTDAVSSVNGFTGAVSLTTSNIAEGTNLYYLDSRARLALSFTAGSGAYDNTTGVITIPTNTSQLTNGANYITLSSLSASSPLSYNSGTGAFSIQVANGSQNGYLSSTDWTTFNSKQPAGNYVTIDTVQTITALKTFTSKVTLNTGGTDDQLQIVGTAPSVRLTNAVTGATINGFIAMSGANDNYIQGSVSGDMTIGNQNNGKILFGFGSGTATQKMSLDSSGNAVLSGGLTLGSTLSNGTYTYTLPGATGTLALTSSLSSYVPYTGATGAVNLGPYDLTVNSVIVGKGAGTGSNNVVLGDNALSANTTGSRNVAIGTFPLWKNTTGTGNIAIGAEALINELSGNNNIAIGDNTAKYITTGSSNTIIGPTSDLSGLTTGSYNTIFGGALNSLGNISNNIILADGQGNIKYRWDGTNNYLYGNTVFSSTISNGTYTYTLPGATGTLALTSAIPANPVGGTGTTNYLPKFTGTSTIGNSIVQDSGGVLSVAGRLSASGNDFHSLIVAEGSAQLKLERTATSTGLMYLGADNVGFKIFDSAFATRLTLTSSGSLGLGVNPSAWNTFKAIEIGGLGNGIAGVSNQVVVFSNAYWNSGYKYASTGEATNYDQVTGQHRWFTAPSGTAGNAISFTQAMTLDASGNLGVGATSVNSRLQVTAAAGLSHARWTESATTVGFVGGAQGIITGHNGKFAIRGESGLVLSGQGNSADMIIASTGAATFSSSVTASSAIVQSAGEDGAAGPVMRLTSTNSNSGARNWAIINTWDNFGDLTFRVSNAKDGNALSSGTSIMTMLRSGLIGIGTTSPSAVLEVAGTSANTDFRISRTVSASTYFYISAPGGSPSTATLGVNGTAVMALNASGNVGIGTTSPFSTAKFQVKTTTNINLGFQTGTTDSTGFKLNAYNDDGSANIPFELNGSIMILKTLETERMRITSGGNVGIGTTSPSELLDVRNSYREPTSGEFTQILSSTTTQDAGRGGSLGFGGFTNGTSGYTTFSGIKGFKENGDGGNTAGALAFYTRVNGGAINERMRITSGGYIGFGVTNVIRPIQVAYSVGGTVMEISNTRNNGTGDFGLVTVLGANDANTSNYHYIASTGVADRCYIYGNGNIVNSNNSYGALSDIRLKENISDTTSKLADLLKVKVRNYNLIGDDKKQLGVIAQELETIFPSMIEIDGKTGMKQVKYSVFVPMLIKAIQELNDKIK